MRAERPGVGLVTERGQAWSECAPAMLASVDAPSHKPEPEHTGAPRVGKAPAPPTRAHSARSIEPVERGDHCVDIGVVAEELQRHVPLLARREPAADRHQRDRIRDRVEHGVGQPHRDERPRHVDSVRKHVESLAQQIHQRDRGELADAFAVSRGAAC